MHGPNVWPDAAALPGWREVVHTYFEGMLALSRVVARGLALSLELPGDFFTSRMQHPIAQLLLLRYPPPPPAQVAAQYVGCGAHTDCGFLTILAQVCVCVCVCVCGAARGGWGWVCSWLLTGA
jgi:isopenicillin N synthase-like dioxygenase